MHGWEWLKRQREIYTSLTTHTLKQVFRTYYMYIWEPCAMAIYM